MEVDVTTLVATEELEDEVCVALEVLFLEPPEPPPPQANSVIVKPQSMRCCALIFMNVSVIMRHIAPLSRKANWITNARRTAVCSHHPYG